MPIFRVLMLATALLPLAQGGVAAAATPAAVPVTVTFSAVLEKRLGHDYGEPERDALRAIVVDSIGRALERRARRAALPADARVEVVLNDALPSHPTRTQGLANPSIDMLRSRSLGGAELTGTVRAADGQVLATASYGYFAPDLETASRAGDAWADARIAIDRLADQLAARLRPSR